MPDRAVYDHHRGGPHRGCGDSVNVEFIGTCSLDRGDDDGHIFRLAACHHSVDCDLFDRGDAHVRGDSCDNVLRVAVCACQHPQHALWRWWYQGQAIGKALIKHELGHVIRAGNVDLAGADRATVRLCAQLVIDAWIEVLGAATGAPSGQSLPVYLRGGETCLCAHISSERFPIGANKTFEAG